MTERKSKEAPGLPDGLNPQKVLSYLDRRTPDLENIRISIGSGDGPEVRMRLREIAHRINGNAALYGLPELGDLAGELVALVDTGDWTTIARSATCVIDRVESEKIRFQE